MTLSLLMFLLVACRPSPLEQAQEQIDIGMPREKAVRILKRKAWYHQPCENRSGVADLFFYGDHRYDRAEIVIMHCVNRGDICEVASLGSFEDYAWQTAYADCIQRDKFDD
jgi:hypothetical protein